MTGTGTGFKYINEKGALKGGTSHQSPDSGDTFIIAEWSGPAA